MCTNFSLFTLDHVDLIEEIANDIYATYEFEAESSTIVNADLASQRITFDTGLFFEVWNKIHPLNSYQNIDESLSFCRYVGRPYRRTSYLHFFQFLQLYHKMLLMKVA